MRNTKGRRGVAARAALAGLLLLTLLALALLPRLQAEVWEYILIGVLAFALGVSFTLLCVGVKRVGGQKEGEDRDD